MQALVLLNDPQFVEATIQLATQLFLEDSNLTNRLIKAFRLMTCQTPTNKQLGQLQKLYEKATKRFQENPKTAIQYLQNGQFTPPKSLPTTSLAAMTLVVNTIMNFDKFYMKR